MKNYKPPLVLYFTACALYLLSVVLKHDNLMLLTKPIIVPSVLFYYFQEAKKVSYVYLTLILLFFLGDMIALLELENGFIWIVGLFFIAYCIFLKCIADDLIQLKLRMRSRMHFTVMLVCMFFLAYLLISLLDILIEERVENIGILICYGVVLVLIGTVSSLCYIVRPGRLTFFMSLSSICFIISDVFYILKTHYSGLDILDWFNNLTQVLSYYFFTKYFIVKKLTLK